MPPRRKTSQPDLPTPQVQTTRRSRSKSKQSAFTANVTTGDPSPRLPPTSPKLIPARSNTSKYSSSAPGNYPSFFDLDSNDPPKIEKLVRPILQPGEHAFDLFAVEVWEDIIKYLRFGDCFKLRQVSTAFRFGLRDQLLQKMLMIEPVHSLREFVLEQMDSMDELLLPPPSISSEPATPTLTGLSQPLSTSLNDFSITRESRSSPVIGPVRFSTLSPLTIPTSPFLGPTQHSPRISGRKLSTSIGSAPSTPKCENYDQKYSDVFRLHNYIQAFIKRGLGEEPDRFTDDFTLWVGYDVNLSDLQRAELRDEWLRKHGGARGKSQAKQYCDWEKAYSNISKELKYHLCRIWAVLGKMFPFTKAENFLWKEVKRQRLQLLGSSPTAGTPASPALSSSSFTPKSKKRGNSNSVAGVLSSPLLTASSGRRDNFDDCGIFDLEEDSGGIHPRHFGKSSISFGRKPSRKSLSQQQQQQQHPQSRSGSPEFGRAILESYVTLSHYLTLLQSPNSPFPGSDSGNELSPLSMESLSLNDLDSGSYNLFVDSGHSSSRASVVHLSEYHRTTKPPPSHVSSSSSSAVQESLPFHLLRRCLHMFAADKKTKVLRFPADIDSSIRKEIHFACRTMSLRTVSFGQGSGRFVVALKHDVVVADSEGAE